MSDSDNIIEVDSLSKQYRLGQVSTGTISHDINRWWARMRGKEDPTLRVTHTNDRAHAAEPDDEFVWALSDINFEVKRGEVLGIIGRNGAGKSTLLKILSRITAPTTGEIRVDGRIASLLEVGTGFHPELTGRENIFLNGAILGMTKAEIRGKLDEIVDFSGCARYLDTPVKRYSSGMVVRLGFAVAAHLEPDILIVDEVLAVGDAEFQKKCIGKMQDVASHGRTVLFVSHNMASVSNLCSRGMILKNGQVSMAGEIDSVISAYMDEGRAISSKVLFDNKETAPGDHIARIQSVEVLDHTGATVSTVDIRKPVVLQMTYWDLCRDACPTAIFHCKDELGNTLFATNEFSASEWKEVHRETGLITARCHIPGNLFAEGRIIVLAAVNTYNPAVIHAYVDEAVSFEVVDHSAGDGVRGPHIGPWPGLMRPWLEWETTGVGPLK